MAVSVMVVSAMLAPVVSELAALCPPRASQPIPDAASFHETGPSGKPAPGGRAGRVLTAPRDIRQSAGSSP
jgi:hypothetical protein